MKKLQDPLVRKTGVTVVLCVSDDSLRLRRRRPSGRLSDKQGGGDGCVEGQKALITDFIYGNQAALYRLAFAYTRSREAALDIVRWYRP